MLHSRNKGLVITDLTLAYQGGQPALDKFHITVPEHSIYTVIGPSGCGKSSLLRAIAGLIKDYQGDIQFNGKSVHEKATLIGLVPQNYGLLPWRTIQANIRVALRIAHPDKADRERQEQQIRHWLEAMGIAELADRYPLSLSGGQQQRVAIARAFALLPTIMLLDEPFSALDALTREKIQQLFLENWLTHPTTTLFVTHDVEEAILLGQKIMVMSSGKGETLEVIDNPLFYQKYEDKRESDEFFQQTKRIRKVMQEKW
ncbi:MAG: ATP-binding cassette domain-containing protein [Gorillibacterium sp.]|nr:ATP-binding cassette domain-containing protein [Gorillibacterium sp.]